MSPARVDAGSVAVDELFAALVCDDPELLDVEFEAIMTANGYAAPPASSRTVRGSTEPGGRVQPAAGTGTWRPRVGPVVLHLHRRQRSPP